MTRFEVRHHGVPIGSVAIDPTGLAIGDLEPNPAYDRIHDKVREASKAFWDLGFFHIEVVRPRIAIEDMVRLALDGFELLDEQQRSVATEFCTVVEPRDRRAAPIVFAGFGRSPAERIRSPRPRRLKGQGEEDEA